MKNMSKNRCTKNGGSYNVIGDLFLLEIKKIDFISTSLIFLKWDDHQ